MKIYGWQDNYNYNNNFFLTLYPVSSSKKIPMPPDMKNVQVVGRILSDDESISVNWGSTLEGANAESGFSAVTTLIQSGALNDLIGQDIATGKTTVSVLETLQKFNGIEPQTLNITLEFQAVKNAYLEVEAPFLFLKKMASPQLTKGIIYNALEKAIHGGDTMTVANTLGDAPFLVNIVYGNNRFLSRKFILENVNSSRDQIKIDKNGNCIRREVSITLKSSYAIMRDEIKIKG